MHHTFYVYQVVHPLQALNLLPTPSYPGYTCYKPNTTPRPFDLQPSGGAAAFEPTESCWPAAACGSSWETQALRDRTEPCNRRSWTTPEWVPRSLNWNSENPPPHRYLKAQSHPNQTLCDNTPTLCVTLVPYLCYHCADSSPPKSLWNF